MSAAANREVVGLLFFASDRCRVYKQAGGASCQSGIWSALFERTLRARLSWSHGRQHQQELPEDAAGQGALRAAQHQAVEGTSMS